MNGSILKLLSVWLLVVFCLPLAAAIPSRQSGGISLLLAGGFGNLSLTLTTNKENYVNGEQIHVSGTAYQGSTPLSDNGTITFSCGEWERRAAILIDGGQYSFDSAISFGDPDGTWNVTLQVGDTTISDNISVSLPPDTVYYAVEIWSPPKGQFYTRGAEVQISVSVTEAGAPVENADVSCRSIKGDNLPPFIENSPGHYYTSYVLGWDEPLGKWSISVEVEKMVGNQLRAGGSYTTVEIRPAVINLDILRPTTHRFARGETVGIEVRATYQNGAIPENVMVTATLPDGEKMSLTKGENDTYVGSYEITSENFAGWVMQTTASDSYGNSGTSSLVISAAPPKGSLPLLLVLLVVTVSLASGIAPSYIGLRKRRNGRLESIREDKKDIRRAQADIAVRYFKKGEIPRETYDRLMHELEGRFTELEKKETMLKEEK
jgi:hypothetical protein